MDSVQSTSPSRSRLRHARRPRRTWFDRLVGGVGETLITAGLIVALFLVWQLWWTGIAANASAQVVQESFEQTQVSSPRVAGHRHTEDPPVAQAVGYGETIGMLVVPDWYGVTNNNMPIVEGTGPDVLDQAAAGHYENTQQVGEVGNFAIAGHRRTNGNSFLRIDMLEPGDEVIVATADTWYVYVVTGYEIVEPHQVEVIAPVPGDLTAVATERTLTLTTCHGLTTGEWGNDHRWITHATLSYWMPRSEGRPESILNDPEVN